MNKKEDNVCRIPVHATMKLINGKWEMVKAVYADIPAKDIAEYIIKKCGVDAIFGGGDTA